MELSQIAVRLAEPTRWLIIAGIAFTLANTVLFFLAPPSNGETGAAARAERIPDRRPTVSVGAIVARNLFGVAGAAATDNSTPAVETRLPLELQAVFVAEDNAASSAIVAEKGRAGELYQVGDLLPGNAELIEVHPDHIVLRRAGARETLRFPQFAGSGIGIDSAGDLTPADGPATQDSAEEFAGTDTGMDDGADTPRDLLETYRTRLSEDPSGALADIGITPVAEGDTRGYRLDQSIADSPYLSQTGLQPGDIVLSVNGQPVGDIEQDRLQIDNILAQGSARIEVQRGTRRFFVTASLNQ